MPTIREVLTDILKKNFNIIVVLSIAMIFVIILRILKVF